MCLLLHKPYGTKVSKEEIEKAWCRNSDGAGFFVNRDGNWTFKKGVMTLKELLDYDIFDEHTETALHLRWASAKTGKTPDLCHPFRFTPLDEGEDEWNYIFHNGNVRMIVPNDKTSDTELFAETFLSNLKTEDGKKVIDSCSKFGYGKYITVNSKVGVRVYDSGTTKGVTENGVYFSNVLHRTYGQQKNWFQNYGCGSTD
jgi:hypothetical protein